jgi:rRNA-processing protein FCF1
LDYHSVRLLLDADGLIKLYRAGVLAIVSETYRCVIPQAVHDEAVTQGEARFHPDAEAIERIVLAPVEILDTPLRTEIVLEDAEVRLGRRERALLSLFSKQHEDVIVSDDRYFLSLLTRHGIPFVTPATLIVLLVRPGVLQRERALRALARIRPLIREAVYEQATRNLEEG